MTGVHNGVIAMADPHPSYTSLEIIDGAYAKDEQPFLVMVDELNYEQNLGLFYVLQWGQGFTV